MTYALDHNLQKRTNDADASETNDNDLADNPLFFGTLKLWISSPRLSLRDVLGVGGGGVTSSKSSDIGIAYHYRCHRTMVGGFRMKEYRTLRGYIGIYYF